MRPRSLCSKIVMLGIGSAVLYAAHFALMAKAAFAARFHLEEATIADVHRAIRAKEITAHQLVQHYFKRIEAYNGTCVRGEVDPATGLMFGEITPIENAGQVNAYMTLNIRGKRSKTDSADNDPKRARLYDRDRRRSSIARPGARLEDGDRFHYLDAAGGWRTRISRKRTRARRRRNPDRH